MTEFRSKVHEAFGGTRSLRTTVPREVAAMLGLEKGDELAWIVAPGSTEGRVRRVEGASKKRISTSR